LGIIAVDAKAFDREGLSGSFTACIGASVVIECDEGFGKRMDDAWKSAREMQGISEEDVALKSVHVKELIGPSDAHDFVAHVVQQMSSYIKEVYFHYTFLDTRRIPLVQVYGRDHGPNTRWDVLEFIQRLNPSYTHCCAWKHMQGLTNQERGRFVFLLDNFEAKVTRAWEELSALGPDHLEVWFSGDLCNPYIRLSDTIVSYIDSKMNISSARLHPRDISGVFSDEPFPVIPSYLGQRYLPYITPLTKRMCDTRPYVKHPILFVAGPSTPPIVRESGVRMREILETHPVMLRIINYARKIGASVKFLHIDGDQRLFRRGDKIMYIGEEAKQSAKTFSELYGISICDAFSLP